MKRLTCLVDNVLLGYKPSIDIPDLFTNLLSALHHPDLPTFEFSEALGSIASRIPQSLSEYFYEAVQQAKSNANPLDFAAIKSKIEKVVEALPLDEQDPASVVLIPIREILDRYVEGVEAQAMTILLGLLENYYRIESLYKGSTHAPVLL